MRETHEYPWFVVESEYETSRTMEFLDEESANMNVLAVTPNAYSSLKESVKEIRGIHEFVSATRSNQIFSENMRSLDRFPDEVDRTVSEQGMEGFRLLDSLHYQIIRTINVLSYHHEALKNFILSESPSAVRFWKHPHEQFHTKRGKPKTNRRLPFLWSHVESPTSFILCDDTFKYQFEVPITPIEPLPIAQNGTTDGVIETGKEIARSILNENRIRGVRGTPWNTFSPIAAKDMRILVFDNDPYLLSFVTESLKTWDLEIDWWNYYWSEPVSLQTGREISVIGASSFDLDAQEWDRLISDCWPREEFPVTISNIMTSRLVRYLSKRANMNFKLHQKAIQYFNEREPIMALVGSADSHDRQLIQKAAHSTGVPVAGFQHGGAYGYIDTPVHYTDLKNDYFCTFGQGVTETMDRIANENGLPAEPLTLGISLLRSGHDTQRIAKIDRGGARLNGQSDSLLYVATSLLGHRLTGPHYWYSDVVYYHHQTQMADVLASLAGLDIKFKPHYKDRVKNPIRRYIQDQEYNINVIDDTPLVEVLPDADLVVIDYPSTTLLEAMIMRKPTIYLDLGWVRWVPEAKRRLEDSIEFLEKKEGWESNLRNLLLRENTIDTSEYDKFLDKYANDNYSPEALWNCVLS